MATDTESMQDNMTRLRMRMMQQKLANERERLQRPDSEESDNGNGYQSQVKLQQAMFRRQDLLDRIKAEQHDSDRRPRTYTPRRRYTPSPLPPPSRRSLPDLSNTKHYHFGYAGGSNPDMTQVRHVIEHQFKNVTGPQGSYALPPIPTQGVPQMTSMPAGYSYPAPEAPRRDTMFNKADFMDMMMLQNAQMHHMVMQQMMLHQLPGGARPYTHPYVEPAAPVALMRPAPSIYHHHINSQPYSMPPMDYYQQGWGW